MRQQSKHSFVLVSAQGCMNDGIAIVAQLPERIRDRFNHHIRERQKEGGTQERPAHSLRKQVTSQQRGLRFILPGAWRACILRAIDRERQIESYSGLSYFNLEI